MVVVVIQVVMVVVMLLMLVVSGPGSLCTGFSGGPVINTGGGC